MSKLINNRANAVITYRLRNAIEKGRLMNAIEQWPNMARKYGLDKSIWVEFYRMENTVSKCHKICISACNKYMKKILWVCKLHHA